MFDAIWGSYGCACSGTLKVTRHRIPEYLRFSLLWLFWDTQSYTPSHPRIFEVLMAVAILGYPKLHAIASQNIWGSHGCGCSGIPKVIRRRIPEDSIVTVFSNSGLCRLCVYVGKLYLCGTLALTLTAHRIFLLWIHNLVRSAIVRHVSV
jgi:hypothetical protein